MLVRVLVPEVVNVVATIGFGCSACGVCWATYEEVIPECHGLLLTRAHPHGDATVHAGLWILPG
jgi:hypothetical protein